MASSNWRIEKARRFVNAAQRAFETSDYETAASRAYYAAYHSVVAAFEVRLAPDRRKWGHYLTPYFRRLPQLATISDSVGRLYDLGVMADYEQTQLTREESEVALLRCREVISLADEVRNA